MYLSLEDSVSFAKTDARIYDLTERHRFTVYKHNDALEKSSKNFLKDAPPFITKYTLEGGSDQQADPLLLILF